ncbi:MAG: TRAP transporter substrate-binding protein [Desulfobacterota bacterium]|nr:TRAP transporter substrate-binding protein [Thermodesulfobacteriota bacterium]
MRHKKGLAGVVSVILFVGLMVSVSLFEKAHAQEVRLRVATYFPPPSMQSKLLEEFCRELESRTGGRVKVDFFAGGSLFPPVATFDNVVSGVADIGYSHVYYTPGRMPVTEAVGLPLAYPSAWVSGQVMNDFYNQFKPKEFDPVKVLWMNTSPPSAIATSKKAIRRLEDLKGLTIRAPGVAGEVIKALGGTPAPTPMPEVYDAISKGVLDGEASNFETLRTFRFAEVVKFSTSVWQITNPFPFYLIMNKESYRKLPADIKPIFDALVGEYKEQYLLMWNAVDFAGKDYGVEKKVEFIELSREEVTRWKAAVEPVIDAYIKRMTARGHTEAEVKGWIKFLRDRIDFWTKKQIDFRIASPAGPPEIKPEALLRR